MRKLVSFCDYFVICSATSDRQVAAIGDYVEDELKQKQVALKINQTNKDSTWIVYDAGDVVTHVFLKDVRSFYDLEYLWHKAKKIKWQK